jgi:hypothetical protein
MSTPPSALSPLDQADRQFSQPQQGQPAQSAGVSALSPLDQADQQFSQPQGQSGNTPPPTPDTIWQGVKETGQDVWGAIKGAATTVFPGQGQLVDSIKDATPAFHAYENARQQGAGVMDSLHAASDVMESHQDALDALSQRIADFKKTPTAATTRAIGDAAALATSIYLGGKIGAPVAEDVPEAAAISKPSLIQRTFNPKGEVNTPSAQPGAQAALRSGASASAADASVEAGAQGGSIRSLLDDPIKNASTAERGMYDSINEASGTDLKSLYDLRSKLQDGLEDPTQIANEDKLQTRLEQTESQIKTGEAQAKENGVDPDTISKAKAATQQRYAMENVKQKLFNNESVVSGNVAHGAPESINVDSAIRQVENLDKPSRFAPEGTPSRLQQAFSEDGAADLKQGLYDAQKAGKTAVARQNIARWVGLPVLGLSAEETIRRALK